MRYGRQSLTEIRLMTAKERRRYIVALSELIKSENNIVGGEQ